MIEFREIDRKNYMDCIALQVSDDQTSFVADNARSLLEAHYEDGLETLAIYHGDTMVGFLLYDFDKDLQGWSLSRFMIGAQYQGTGFGKAALHAFLGYFESHVGKEKLYACVSIQNEAMAAMLNAFGFTFVEKVEYTFGGKVFKENKLAKEP